MTEVIKELSQPAVDYQNESYQHAKEIKKEEKINDKSEKKLRKQGKKRQIQRTMLIEFAKVHHGGIINYEIPVGCEDNYLVMGEWMSPEATVDAFIDYADDVFMKWYKMSDMDLKSEFIRFVRNVRNNTEGTTNGGK